MTDTFKIGDRVQIRRNSGFSRGAIGTVVETPKTHNNVFEGHLILWVERDGSASPMFFFEWELQAHPQPKQNTDQERLEFMLRYTGLKREEIDALMTKDLTPKDQ